MPQPGEIRRGATETVQWDGSRWNPVDDQTSAASSDSGVGGFLSDLYHGVTEHPLDTLKGFFQGAAQGAPTATRIAQVALPLATGGTSIPVQMAIGAGTQAVADLADKIAGDPSAPSSLTDALEHAATGAIAPGILGAAGAGVRAIAPYAQKGTIGGTTGALVGGYEGYKLHGIPGALEGAALGAMGGSKLANKFGDLFSAEEEAAPVVGRVVKAGSPGASPTTAEDVLDGILNDYRQQPAETPYAPNTNPTPDVRSVDRGNLTVPPEPSPAAAAHSAAEEFNIRQNAPYGEGAIMPSAVQPTEFRAAALDGLNAPQTAPPHDVDYQLLTGKPYMPASEVVDTAEPAQTSPSQADVDALVNQIPSTQVPASLRALDTHTGDPSTIGEWFDRGSFDTGAQAAPLKGEEGYAYDPTSANLRADPQTAVNDLLQAREDALQRGDLSAARGYSRDISQRNKAGFNIATGKRLPFKKGISVLKVKLPASVASGTDNIPF